MPIAIGYGESYRVQTYEFLLALAQGGFSFQKLSSVTMKIKVLVETGLGSLISPMLKVLDDMYKAQNDLIKWAVDDLYKSKEAYKEPVSIDLDLAMAWAARLDDGALESNAPAINWVWGDREIGGRGSKGRRRGRNWGLR